MPSLPPSSGCSPPAESIGTLITRERDDHDSRRDFGGLLRLTIHFSLF